MKEQLEEYFKFKQSLDDIRSIMADNQYDKKGWYLSGREYVSDFGIFKASYTAGTYGSSSVSNRLSGLKTEEGKKLFEKFIESRMLTLLSDFEKYYKANLQDAAKQQKEFHKNSIEKLDKIFKEAADE